VAAELALAGARDRAEQAGFAERFGLSALLARHPLALSGGERQRLALALVAADADARVVLLDEPTVGLDARSRAMLVTLLAERVARGDLVIAATHDARLVALAGERIELGEGRATRAVRAEVAV
ncbi:MAG: ATP-binding cassette domain-containing protein, partial [Thermoplasmatota archaeon]